MPHDFSTSDHAVSLDELNGAGKSPAFDQAVDNGDIEDFQVIYRRGDEETILARPSRAIYFGDPELYRQEAAIFEQLERSDVLNLSQFPDNDRVFSELKACCRNGFAIPFVGAGMSVSAGCLSWRGYLLSLAQKANLDAGDIQTRLDEANDYEGVMEDVLRALGEPRFERDFERDFKAADDLSDSAVALLPQIFGRCVVTTNFDRVVEDTWRDANKNFREKVFGRGNTSTFFRAVTSGERYLLKLHGNLDSPAERVLRRTEYDAAYGSQTNPIDFDCPLPKILKRLFMSYSFVFLGCSLTADRTIQTFTRVCAEEGHGNLPHHFAILEYPDDFTAQGALNGRLAEAHITPLWYPEGEYGSVARILQLLLA